MSNQEMLSLPVRSGIFRKFLPNLPTIKTKTFQTRFLSLLKMTTHAKWKAEKAKMLSMPLVEKRKLYKSPDFVILDKVDPWCNYVVLNKGVEAKKHTLEDLNEFQKIKLDPTMNKSLSERVSIYKGDITQLEVRPRNCYFVFDNIIYQDTEYV